MTVQFLDVLLLGVTVGCAIVAVLVPVFVLLFLITWLFERFYP